jgi:hypothetical protein
LDDIHNLFGVTQKELFITKSCKFYFLKTKRLKDKYPQSILNRCLDFCERVSVIEEFDDEMNGRLSSLEDIDPGEAILFAASVLFSESIILTGDKRSIESLANFEDKEKFKNRIMILEQIIQRYIQLKGFDVIKNKIIPFKEFDTSIRAIFGSGDLSNFKNVETSLNLYIDALRKTTGKLLIDS